jgi:hypothetical protein
MKDQHKENFWFGTSGLWRRGCPKYKPLIYSWSPVVFDDSFNLYVYTIRTKLCQCHSMNLGNEPSGNKNQYAKSLKNK